MAKGGGLENGILWCGPGHSVGEGAWRSFAVLPAIALRAFLQLQTPAHWGGVKTLFCKRLLGCRRVTLMAIVFVSSSAPPFIRGTSCSPLCAYNQQWGRDLPHVPCCADMGSLMTSDGHKTVRPPPPPYPVHG